MKYTMGKLCVSNIYFDYLYPENYRYAIEEIAWSLSKQCRFIGHINAPGIYSVAEHSVLVSKLVPHSLALFTLMNDAGKAYTGDIIGPLKKLLPDFKEIEKKVEKALSNYFGLVRLVHPKIKLAYLTVLAAERRDLRPLGVGAARTGMIAPSEPIKCMPPPLAYEYFMHHWRLYNNQLNQKWHTELDWFELKHSLNGRVLFATFAKDKVELLKIAIREDALITRADLSNLDLREVDLRGVILSLCNLEGTLLPE